MSFQLFQSKKRKKEKEDFDSFVQTLCEHTCQKQENNLVRKGEQIWLNIVGGSSSKLFCIIPVEEEIAERERERAISYNMQPLSNKTGA